MNKKLTFSIIYASSGYFFYFRVKWGHHLQECLFYDWCIKDRSVVIPIIILFKWDSAVLSSKNNLNWAQARLVNPLNQTLSYLIGKLASVIRSSSICIKHCCISMGFWRWILNGHSMKGRGIWFLNRGSLLHKFHPSLPHYSTSKAPTLCW